ncbi:glycosyltransferase family 2 protein [Chryseobacterium sp. MDT2-18]|uniref:glycosyltransferase family 2 protein n=1 Tax=Chryseobacterium sp. MDT2-18 TaxID=1259136 RepID=UPI0027858EB0|nr:glycosyltransferase family 2 protein [Chryseobacterium sp. MDT2-18]MDQ0478168.1 glycosyltransferase involved in cell wall biosynthesis [Chryseobacterium sp. MDT2-18]
MPLISVIIPCYNVEKYVIKCLESVYLQQFPTEEFEVILVDDESTDDVVKIATAYLTGKTNWKIIRQSNKGLGGARNTGIRNAVGKYIIFLDADDQLVLQNYFFLKNCNAQIIQLASENVSNSGRVISSYHPPDITNIKGRDFWLNHVIMPSVCNKMYLRTFLNDHSLEFKEHLYSEDIEFNSRAFFYAENVKVKNQIFQHFLQTPDSITRNNCITNRKKLFGDLFAIIKYLVLFKEDKSKLVEDRRYFDKIISDIALGAINMGLRNAIDKSEVYKLKEFLLTHNIPIFTIVYDNNYKNLFKYILRIPYSVVILKILLKK